jgi:hypothetical protein
VGLQLVNLREGGADHRKPLLRARKLPLHLVHQLALSLRFLLLVSLALLFYIVETIRFAKVSGELFDRLLLRLVEDAEQALSFHRELPSTESEAMDVSAHALGSFVCPASDAYYVGAKSLRHGQKDS